MVKPELGTKRHCPNCGAKYYDLNRDPITCPRCGTFFEPTARLRTKQPAVVEDEEDVVAEGTEAAEFVTLEEADQEAAGGAEVPSDDDEDVEIEGDDDDDAFLPDEEEEEDDDVSGIIGDVDDDEER